MKNNKKQKAFPRYPIPKKEDLKKSLMRLAETIGDGDYNWQLYAYIRARIGDILTSRELMEDTLERENERIERAKKTIEIALELVDDGTKRDNLRKEVDKRLSD